MNKVAVIGACNMDLSAFGSEIKLKDSNPGKLVKSVGGVAHNIAANLSLLGEEISFLTLFGNDVFAKEIKKDCLKYNFDLSMAKEIEADSPCYISINDDKDMLVAIVDSNIFDYLTCDYFKENIDILNQCKAVVLDTNLNEECLAYLFENIKVPIFVDPVSSVKSKKLIPYLNKIHTIKPNRYEIESLSGIAVNSIDSALKAIECLYDKGVKNVFLSLDQEGLIFMEERNYYKINAYSKNIVGVSGCGDAMMAGIVAAYCNGLDTKETAMFASACSAITIQSEKSINSLLNKDSVYKFIESEELSYEQIFRY